MATLVSVSQPGIIGAAVLPDGLAEFARQNEISYQFLRRLVTELWGPAGSGHAWSLSARDKRAIRLAAAFASSSGYVGGPTGRAWMPTAVNIARRVLVAPDDRHSWLFISRNPSGRVISFELFTSPPDTPAWFTAQPHVVTILVIPPITQET